MNTKSFLFATLIAGAAMALLGNLPAINLCNCFLCIWVWLGGALSVVLYRRFQRGAPGPIARQGAGLGAVSGVIGAVLGFGVFLITSSITTPIMESLARTLNIQGAPFSSGGMGDGLLMAVLFLMIDLVLYPFFGALGGLIAANMGRSSATPTPAVI